MPCARKWRVTGANPSSPGRLLWLGIDREQHNVLGRAKDRHRIVKRAVRLAAAIPRNQHTPADAGEVAGVGHDEDRTAAPQDHLLGQVRRNASIRAIRIVLAEDGDIGIAGHS